MKIIDLLNKIANGEEVPKKIKVNNKFVYEYDKDIDYKSKDGTYLFDSYIQITKQDMNIEVEIIEEDKKIEKLDLRKKDDGFLYLHGNIIVNQDFAFALKINELIDKLNSLEKKQ